MKQEHFPWDRKVFRNGVNTDAEQRDIASADGIITDAQNTRTNNDAGDNGSRSKIKGETAIYGDLGLPGGQTYWNVGRIDVAGGLFEAWASDQPALYDPIIRYKGIIIAQSSGIPYKWDQPLVFDKSEDCDGGMVFDARSKAVPIHWPVKDMVDAQVAGLQTYFSGFNPSLVQVNPTRPVNRPVFLGLVDVGAGNGLSGGQVWYYFRLVNNTGDRTPDGPPVGPVFVPFHRGEGWFNINHRPWPSADTAGINPGQVGVPTGFGVSLKVRVNNVANFDNLELVRMYWAEDGGPDALPVIQIAKRIAITPGENQPHYLVDDGEVLDEIAQDESVVQTHFIKRAEGVRYIAFRVAYLNVELGAKDINADWIDNGGRVFPVTRSIGRTGHADPVNACYKRSFKRGGRHNLGAVFWDTVGGSSYVDVITENNTAPNRRDEKADDSLAWSDSPAYAATVDHEVRPTFEVFDLDIALGKSQTKQVINIMQEGRRKVSGSGDFPGQAFTPGVDTSPGSPPGGGVYPSTNDGVYIDSASGGPWVKSDYAKPLPPQFANRNQWGHDYKVNVAVHPVADSEASVPYEPKVYAPRMHSLAMAVRGLNSIPPGVQGVSIVATPGTRRVVTQGIAKWKLVPGQHPNPSGTQNRATKDTWQLHVCFPEQGANYLSQDIIDGINASDGRYGLQLVSPLGITTEQFGSVMADRPNGPSFNAIPFTPQFPPNNATGFSALADLLSVARVLWDTGQCNPGNSTGGYSPASPLPGGADHFVGFDSWGSGPRPNSPWHSPGFNGNRIFQYTNVAEVTHGSGDRSFVFTMDAQVYGIGACPSSDFNSPAAQAFREPFYVVNLVEDSAQVDDASGYRTLNHYIPFVSDIGTTNGQNTQLLPLVDERFDDVWSTQNGAERFVWLIGPSGTRPFLFIGAFWPQYATIVNAIATDGFWVTPGGVQVYGIYDMQFGATTQEASILLLTQTEAGQRVEVRYNNAVPMVVFGDQFIAPAFGTIVDEAASALPPSPVAAGAFATLGGEARWPVYFPQLFSGNALITGGLPVPFSNYEYNGNYMVPFGMGFGITGGNDHRFSVNQRRHGTIMSIRQWKVLFDCEVSAELFMSRYETPFNIWYPFINYQQRPYNALPNNSLTANGIAAGYSSHYGDGPSEWLFGGIKDAMLPLEAYSIHPGPAYFKMAEFGQQEKTKQCAALVYSEKAPPVSQDLPGLKTFPVDNIEYIEPTRGAGQYLYSQTAEGTGYNLYAIMERGEKMLLIEKNIARSESGEDFAMFRQDNFIGGGEWIGRAGMPGDFWMTAAEGYPFMPGGSEKREALGWWNGESYFWLLGNQVLDMAEGQYRKGIRSIMQGFDITQNRMSGGYDRTMDEMLLMGPGGIAAFACSKNTHHWMGFWTHQYHNIGYSNGSMHGFRDLTTYRMNEGEEINGQLVRAWVMVPSAPFPGERMEWRRLKVDSPRKPLRIEFYDETGALVCWTDAQRAQFLGYPDWTYMRKVTNWECPVPSVNEAVNAQKPRMQGSICWYRIIFEGEGPDVISSSAIQVKPLK